MEKEGGKSRCKLSTGSPTSPIKYEDVLLAEDPRDEHNQPFLPEVTLSLFFAPLLTNFSIF